LYAVEACQLLARQIQSIEFTSTRTFLKLFLQLTRVVLILAIFLLNLILIRTAKFLQKFTASENSLYTLLVSDARQQLRGIFMQLEESIQTACQLHSAVYSKLFNN